MSSIKNRLKDYRELLQYIMQLEEDISTLMSKAENLRSFQNTELGVRIQKTGSQDPIGDIIAEYLDMAILLGEKLKIAIEERSVLEDLTKSLPPTSKRVIGLRYFHGHSWEQVADEMGYSVSRVWHMHGEILRDLEA